MRTRNNPKIIIEFTSPEDAVEWFDAAKADGHFPEGSELFNADALDFGRVSPDTYIVREARDRISSSAVREDVGSAG